MTEAQYQLITASGNVAEAARGLLAWIVKPVGRTVTVCFCCQLSDGAHDATLPCGQLQAGLQALGVAVRAVTLPPTPPTPPAAPASPETSAKKKEG